MTNFNSEAPKRWFGKVGWSRYREQNVQRQEDIKWPIEFMELRGSPCPWKSRCSHERQEKVWWGQILKNCIYN